MLANSKLNSVTFKDLSGVYPNKHNRLHKDRFQGAFTTKEYCQKYPNSHVVYLQFSSEDSGDVTLKAFDPALIQTIVSSYVSSVVGDTTRYWFNFVVTLTAAYQDKSVYFTATQGADVLTSEPIYTSDISEDIERGRIVYVKYTNLDRNNSDLDDRFIDWAALTNDGKFMDFFIEAVDRLPGDTDENEILEGSQSLTTIAASYFAGRTFQTDIIPDYLATKLGIASSLDVFTINDIQYIKPDGAEMEIVGGSTSVQVSIGITEKNTIGINVDNLGIESTDDMEWHKEYNSDTISANFDIEEPDGYITSNIQLLAAGTSIPDQTIVKVGYTIGGDEIGEAIISKSATIPIPIMSNTRSSFDASGRIYFTFSGDSGYVLRIKVLFQLNDIS